MVSTKIDAIHLPFTVKSFQRILAAEHLALMGTVQTVPLDPKKRDHPRASDCKLGAVIECVRRLDGEGCD